MWAKLALAPALWLQGWGVRRRALRLPEAAGPRSGLAGHGPTVLRLLVVGDSAAAGVGVAHQDQALAAPLAAALAAQLGGSVAWQLLATTGHTAADALTALCSAPVQPADVMVLALGVNDVVAQTAPRRWLATLDSLHATAQQRAGVLHTLHTAVPPLGRFPLLPQPLRSVMGRDARRLEQALRRHVAGQADRSHAPLPLPPPGAPVPDWMAVDGFHPGARAYLAWSRQLAGQLAQWAASGNTAGLLSSPPVPHCGQ